MACSLLFIFANHHERRLARRCRDAHQLRAVDLDSGLGEVGEEATARISRIFPVKIKGFAVVLHSQRRFYILEVVDYS